MPPTRELRGSLRGPAVVVQPHVHGGHAGLRQPRVPVDNRRRLGKPGGVRSFEVVGVHGVVLVSLEVLDEKLGKLWGAVGGIRVFRPVAAAAGHVLEIYQKRKALLVGNLGEDVVGVDTACQCGLEHGVRVALTQPGHGLLELHQTADGVEVENALAVHLVHDLALDEHGEPLVEPEVLPGFVRHQVTTPRVRDLVRHHVRLASIPRQQSRGHKRQTRVLHPSIRERRRQEEKVVTPPHVRTCHLLSRLEEILSLGEFKRTRLDHLGLAPNLGTGTNLDSLHVANRQRQ